MNFVGSKEVVLLDCERTLNNELTKNKQEDGKYHTCPCLTMLIVPSSAQQLNLLKKLLHYLQLPIMRTLQEESCYCMLPCAFCFWGFSCILPVCFGLPSCFPLFNIIILCLSIKKKNFPIQEGLVF